MYLLSTTAVAGTVYAGFPEPSSDCARMSEPGKKPTRTSINTKDQLIKFLTSQARLAVRGHDWTKSSNFHQRSAELIDNYTGQGLRMLCFKHGQNYSSGRRIFRPLMALQTGNMNYLLLTGTKYGAHTVGFSSGINRDGKVVDDPDKGYCEANAALKAVKANRQLWVAGIEDGEAIIQTINSSPRTSKEIKLGPVGSHDWCGSLDFDLVNNQLIVFNKEAKKFYVIDIESAALIREEPSSYNTFKILSHKGQIYGFEASSARSFGINHYYEPDAVESIIINANLGKRFGKIDDVAIHPESGLFYIASQARIAIYNPNTANVELEFQVPGSNKKIHSLSFNENNDLVVCGEGSSFNCQGRAILGIRDQGTVITMPNDFIQELAKLPFDETVQLQTNLEPGFLVQTPIRAKLSTDSPRVVVSSEAKLHDKVPGGIYYQGAEGSCVVMSLANALEAMGIDLPEALILDLTKQALSPNGDNDSGLAFSSVKESVDKFDDLGFDINLNPVALTVLNKMTETDRIRELGLALKQRLDSGSKFVASVSYSKFMGIGAPGEDGHALAVIDYNIDENGHMNLIVQDSNSTKTLIVPLECFVESMTGSLIELSLKTLA